MKIAVNNLSLNYTERGLPNGLPVVFIHGFPFDHTMWEPQMKALPNDIRAITYDIRGHGDSEVGDGQYSIEYFVDDLIGLLDHLVIQQAVICGLSMGGYVALRAIERHPDRFKALILCDTRSEPDGNEAKVKRAGQAKAVKANGTKEFAAGFVKAVFTQQSLDSKPEIVGKIRSIIEATSPTGISGTLLAMASRTDTTPALSSIKVPTLILVGEHDTLTPPSASQAMKEKIAGAEMHVIPGSAHMSNLENAEFFNEKLIGFLKKGF